MSRDVSRADPDSIENGEDAESRDLIRKPAAPAHSRDEDIRAHKLHADASAALSASSGMSLFFAFNDDDAGKADADYRQFEIDARDDAQMPTFSPESHLQRDGGALDGEDGPAVAPEGKLDRDPHRPLSGLKLSDPEAPSLTISDIAGTSGAPVRKAPSTLAGSDAASVPDTQPAENTSEIVAPPPSETKTADPEPTTERDTGNRDAYDVTTPIDIDVAANAIAENATAGTTVGITALATDADATTNTVTYAVNDARFAIDASG
ncbi:MAG: hypothetical protein KDJ77_18285, partial [Rhodobiaceae bacterium]|nr:hypothetical protein [Rhodobiaceae bacterium]